MHGATTITIDREQRDGLYELVRNHLGSVGDLFDALERDKDYTTAARLGLEFSEDFRLLDDIGWGEEAGRESFELTMPPHDLMEDPRRTPVDLRGTWSPPSGRPDAGALVAALCRAHPTGAAACPLPCRA